MASRAQCNRAYEVCLRKNDKNDFFHFSAAHGSDVEFLAMNLNLDCIHLSWSDFFLRINLILGEFFFFQIHRNSFKTFQIQFQQFIDFFLAK